MTMFRAGDRPVCLLIMATPSSAACLPIVLKISYGVLELVRAGAAEPEEADRMNMTA